MKKTIFMLLVIVIPMIALSQETEKKKFSIKLKGFVKSDFFFDSRQTVAAREGHFLLYPSNESLDLDGNDINAKANFNFLNIQSRLTVAITGPTVLGAKTSGVIEGDFFAQANDNINLLRLRHAYLKLNWNSTELLFGQYWIPMFVTGCFPGTVSFNTGVPMQPFGRNPQIRLTQKAGPLKILGIVSSQRDYANIGPDGSSGKYMRNGGIPAIDFQLHFDQDFSDDFSVLVGIGGGYKKMLPKTFTEIVTDPTTIPVTTVKYKTDDAVNSMSFIGFTKIKAPFLTFKAEFVLGQNMTDVLGIGGYAQTAITDPIRGFVDYKPFTTMSTWIDMHTNGKKFQVGVFGGFTKNMGTSEDILIIPNTDTKFGRGLNMESVFRISPRLIFNAGPVRFALEGEYTSAGYTTPTSTYSTKGVPEGVKAIGNMRILLGVYYFFK